MPDQVFDRPSRGKLSGRMAVDHASPGSAARPGGLSAVTAAGTVHDLGNLIQIATSAVDVIAHMPDMSADQAKLVFARARTSLEQAGALVRHTIGLVLDRSSVSDRSSVAACLSDVATLVDGVAHSGFTVEIQVEPDLPDVKCNPVALQNALLNLVMNARESMAGQGTVLVGARAIQDGEPMVELRIADTGVGMSPATIARAFEPFFTTKSDGLGGVGLPMVEQFVREAGGDISIESEPGVGTTVALRLPMVLDASASGPAVRASSLLEE